MEFPSQESFFIVLPADVHCSHPRTFRCLKWTHSFDIIPRGGPSSINRPSKGKLLIVLLHGFLQSSSSWEDFAGNLCRNSNFLSGSFGEITVVAIDMPGHGRSSWRPDGNYSREESVRDLEELLVVLRGDFGAYDRLILVGMSMGGALASSIVANNPSLVWALCLVDWAPLARGDEPPPSGVAKIVGAFQMSWPTFEEAVSFMCKFNPRRTRENIEIRLKEQLYETNGKWCWHVDPAIVPWMTKRMKEDSSVMWEVVEKISCPVLVVRGEQSDVLDSDRSQQLVESLSLGSLAIIENAGHSVPGDNPEGFASTVNHWIHKLLFPSKI